MSARESMLAMRPSGADYYCLGFIFDVSGSRVLLQKKRLDCPIESLRGSWNGIGGKVGADEHFDEAMKREGLEEAGLSPPWRQFAVVVNQGWQMNVFSAVVIELPEFTSGTELHTIWPLQMVAQSLIMAPYVKWLVPAAWDLRARGKLTVDLRG